MPIMKVKDKKTGNFINIPSIIGPKGAPGKDGLNGKDGAPGRDGIDSISVINNVDLTDVRTPGYYIVGDNVTNNNQEIGSAYLPLRKGQILINVAEEMTVTDHTNGVSTDVNVLQVSQTMVNGHNFYTRSFQIIKASGAFRTKGIWSYTSLMSLVNKTKDIMDVYLSMTSSSANGVASSYDAYPDGFNNFNCVIVGVMWKCEEYGDEWVTGEFSNRVKDVFAQLGESTVTGQLTDTSVPKELDFQMKITLLKVY